MKKRVIEELQRKNALSERAAGAMVDNVFAAVQGVLDGGEKVNIQGFGTFERKFRDQRQGRNPRTGEPVTIAARHSIKFKEARKQTR